MDRRHGINVRIALVVMMSVFVPIVVARADSSADAWITMTAKSALHFAAGFRVSTVNVDTSDGRVTLSGKVQSEKDKAGAADEVRNLAGVVQVRNLLQVVAPGNQERVERSDDAVKTDVERTLRADRSLDDSSITVRSVSNGVVLLSGDAASSNDNVRALRSAADRVGVRRVFSEIEAPDALNVPSGARHVWIPIEVVSSVEDDPVAAEDDVIRLGVKRALIDLDARENADIHVLVRDGVVWLTGSVPTWQGNSSRLYAARSVTGVRSIMNGLRVGALDVDAQRRTR